MPSQHLKLVEENKILELRVGSHLYGTYTPESDLDYEGVFLPSEEYVFGLQSIEEVDLSKIDKNAAGQNTADAVDRKFYEFRKFISLCIQCNPNKLELLFAPEEAVLFKNELGERLLEARHLFPYKGAHKRFLGYASSQKHKMRIRSGNYDNLKVVHAALAEIQQEDPQLTIKDIQYQYDGTGLSFKKSHAQAGDLNFMYHLKVGKVVRMIKERLDKATNRSGLMDRYGYDTKFASHLVRLLLEGRRLLQTGELIFPLPEAHIVKDIKLGKWDMKEVLQLSNELEAEIELAAKKTHLPAKPRYAEIEALTISIMKEHLSLAA